MSLASERDAVQDPLVRYAEAAGWTYLPPDDALLLGRGEGGLLLHDVFVQQAQRLNPGVVAPGRAEHLLGRLLRLPPTIKGNLAVWEHLRGARTVFVDSERRERDVRFPDVARPDTDAFHVTDEFAYTNGQRRVRADVVFFVNGLPVLLVETKAATRVEGIAEALEQAIRRAFRRPEDAPKLLIVTEKLLTGYDAPVLSCMYLDKPIRDRVLPRAIVAAGDRRSVS